MEVELVEVEVQAQIRVDAYAVVAGAGLGRRKNPQAGSSRLGNFWTSGARTIKSREPIGSYGTSPCNYLPR